MMMHRSGRFASPGGTALLGLLWVLAGLPSPASAHDKWLEVEPFVMAAPATAKVYLLTGEAFQKWELLPERRRKRIGRFQVVSAAGSRDLGPRFREDQEPIAVLSAGDLALGTSILMLDKAPQEIELSADKFQAYLFEERLIDILAFRAQRGQEDLPGRERYSRSLKALVQVGPRLSDRVTQPAGQELEVVPLQNPYGVASGGTLSAQVFFHGRPLAGRAVTIANRYRAHIATRILRTDREGKISIALQRPGDWMFALVHMEASAEPGVDWRSYWTSLTFQLPEPATAPRR